MTFKRFILPTSIYTKIVSQYNSSLLERFEHRNVSFTTGPILLGRTTNIKDATGRIYFHPANSLSQINMNKTFSIFLSTKNYGIPLTTLSYNDGTGDKTIIRLEFGYDPDMRMDLIPLYTIKENLLYIEILYMQNVLKYYVADFTGSGTFSLFESNISTDLPLLFNRLQTLSTAQTGSISIIPEKEATWYGKNHDSTALTKEINLLIGEIDQKIPNQRTQAYVLDDNGASYKLLKRTAANKSITITTNADVTVFEASFNTTVTPTTIEPNNPAPVLSIYSTNTSDEGLFYYCHILGGNGVTSKINGITINTPNANFGKLTARINYINQLLKP